MLGTGALSLGETTFSVLTLLAALGCGLIGGFFFAFSFLVMKALAQQPPGAGMATMQTINVVVFNPWFGGAFTITAIACVLVTIVSIFRWEQSGAYAFIGGLLYLVGTLGVTATCNVPRNDALAAWRRQRRVPPTCGPDILTNGRCGITREWLQRMRLPQRSRWC